MPRFHIRLGSAGVLLVYLLELSAGAAIAGNANGYRAGLDSTVSFNHSSLTTIFHDAAHTTDSTDIEPTDITTSLFHDTAGKEISIYDFTYESQYYGWYECHASEWKNQKTICYNGHVHIDLFDPPGGSYSVTEANALMCQEVGHSVGLAHSVQWGSCMYDPLPTRWFETDFSTHDDGVVNGIY